MFGVLHSKVHETWARATGSQLREEESGFRHTPTSTFGTFPLPEVQTLSVTRLRPPHESWTACDSDG
jgi:hypothetical protein